MKSKLLFLSLSLALATMVSSCRGDRTKQGTEEPKPSEVQVLSSSEPTTTFNIFVENSGSMKGFFNQKNTLKQIIKEYYDRIDETKSPITLNLINNTIVRKNNDINYYLKNIFSQCNARNSELDKILEIAMDTLKDNEVNLVISDYCFESPNSDFAMARSGITKIFKERLNSGKDLAVAIVKYNCEFNGTNYPSRQKCTHDVPAYVWEFGSTKLIKKVLQIPIKVSSETMVLEPFKTIKPHFINYHSRMVDKDNKVIVKEWKEDRRTNVYILNFELDLSCTAINERYLTDVNNYSITNGFSIESITRKTDSDTYVFRINTTHPSPGDVKISLNNKLPQWVFDSNFDNPNIVPDSGKTFGIKYLIEGVFDAFNNQNNCILSTTISLKK